jgi:hypothetical protein
MISGLDILGLDVLSLERGWWHIEEPAAAGKLVAAMAVGRESVIADAMEAGGQDVHQKAADELADSEPLYRAVQIQATRRRKNRPPRRSLAQNVPH